jgi:hypothetical protein
VSELADLLIVVPTRGRPANVRRLVGALAQTLESRAELALGLDDDDPTLPETYVAVADAPFPVNLHTGRRNTWGAWTNDIAISAVGRFRALCSLGDDHVPLTQGWDTRLIGAIDGAGGTGFAYANDLLQGYRLPTAVVVSSDIVRSLGWLCQPSLRHYFADNVWMALGESAECIKYLPFVAIEHRHHARTGQFDTTYLEASAYWQADRAAYHAWYHDQKAADVLKIKKLKHQGPARLPGRAPRLVLPKFLFFPNEPWCLDRVRSWLRAVPARNARMSGGGSPP